MTQITIPAQLLPRDGRFGCGPSKVRSAQLDALARLNPGTLGTSHRQSPVKTLVGGVQRRLLELFNAPDGYEILLGNGGATLFWDSAAHSLIRSRSQHATFGEFGTKFAESVAAAPFLRQPLRISAEPGSAAECESAALVDVYAYPHNETSTGAMVPVRRIPGSADTLDALTVVDATSAAGGIMFDAANTDVYYFSPQKNFGSDGGLWLALVSPAAIERIAEITTSERYIPETLNLKVAVENSRKQQTLNTPALVTLAMLDAQLAWMLDNGGLSWADTRTRTSSDMLYNWAAERDFVTPFVADPKHRSQVVVTLDFASHIDAATISAALRANGVVDTEPYRKLGRNQLRIATFAAIEPQDVAQLIRCLDYVIERL